MSLFDPICPVGDVAAYLDANHYLGRATRGFAWSDEYGVLVLANPTARFLPQQTWLELIRWCLVGIPNGGSQQWAKVARCHLIREQVLRDRYGFDVHERWHEDFWVPGCELHHRALDNPNSRPRILLARRDLPLRLERRADDDPRIAARLDLDYGERERLTPARRAA